MGDRPLDPALPDLVPPLAREVALWLRGVLAPGAALRGDSRAIRPGDAFFAIRGYRDDGRQFIGDAIARGAGAVVYEAQGASGIALGSVPGCAVESLRELAGPIASDFHDRPSERMEVVAVTGTNGKTSASQWIARGLAGLGRRCAVVGTLGCGPVDRLEPSGLTTPDALGLQAMFARLAAGGMELVAAEASSIGLDQGRLNGSRITVAAYTNLSRDHLDYHGTMQAYAAAKARLFGWPGLRVAVINGDDEHSTRMIAAASVHSPLRIVYGVAPSQHGAHGDAVLIAERVVEGPSGIGFVIGGDFGRAEVGLRLLGSFNVSNALAVAGCWLGMGLGLDQVVQGLESLEPVPGRMQMIERPNAPLAVIDYAHSPDALASVLMALRPVAQARGGELWCVFGAGGDRDTGKRPLMGLVAERGADRLVITSDNPRSESPFRIVSDVRAGLSREPALTEIDRHVAIDCALRLSSPRDVVLIAGKGHEEYQEIAGVRHPFSDLAVALGALRARAEADDV